jgi:hypothetical protein
MPPQQTVKKLKKATAYWEATMVAYIQLKRQSTLKFAGSNPARVLGLRDFIVMQLCNN